MLKDWINGLLRISYAIWRKYFPRSQSNTSANRKFTRIHQFDESFPEDIEDILEISAYLEIREFDIFQLAYRWWFGRQPPLKVIESHFVKYMFHKTVPHYVRQYSRMCLELLAEDKLTRESIGVENLPDATPESVSAGIRYTVVVFSALALLILLAEIAYKLSFMTCMFPPCY